MDFYKKYPGPFADTYSYCLIPNHFHFLIRIRVNGDEQEFVRMMRIWLIKYAMYLNRIRNRRGHLFTRPINRIKVTDEGYLKNIIRYIHLNPVKHRITLDYKNYTYSSYRTILSKTQSDFLLKDEVLTLFNEDYLEFIDFHDSEQDDEEIVRFIIEEK
jgi:hypothetical protein